MDSDLLLVLVVVAAVAFDLMNGFHDGCNAASTIIYTKALKPRTAIFKSAGELDAMESECDNMRRDIPGNLYSAGFFPMRRFELPPDLNMLLEEISETVLKAVRKLRDVILKMQPGMRESMDESEEVERIEAEVADQAAYCAGTIHPIAIRHLEVS